MFHDFPRQNPGLDTPKFVNECHKYFTNRNNKNRQNILKNVPGQKVVFSEYNQ